MTPIVLNKFCLNYFSVSALPTEKLGESRKMVHRVCIGYVLKLIVNTENL